MNNDKVFKSKPSTTILNRLYKQRIRYQTKLGELNTQSQTAKE